MIIKADYQTQRERIRVGDRIDHFLLNNFFSPVAFDIYAVSISPEEMKEDTLDTIVFLSHKVTHVLSYPNQYLPNRGFRLHPKETNGKTPEALLVPENGAYTYVGKVYPREKF